MKKNKKNKKIDYQARRERIENLKNMGGSLFSNQRAIDAGTHNSWWLALIVFILSVFIPIIPLLSQGFTISGADIFARKSYGFDTTGTALVSEMASKGVDLQINDEHELIDVNDGWKTNYANHGDDIHYAYVNSVTHQYDLLVYYKPEVGKTNFQNFVKLVDERKYNPGTTEVYVKPEKPETSENNSSTSTTPTPEIIPYQPNVIVMNKNYFLLNLYEPNSTKSIGGIAGDYLSLQPGYKFSDIGKVEGVSVENQLISNSKYTNGVLNNWKYLVDKAYLHNRNAAATAQSLTSLGIYVVLGLFMGLMIFLLTRGKRNINRRYTFLQCLKIESWSMLCPALLAMIMGFIIPQGSIMFFIIFIGIRTMWMSMKQLKPVMR